MKKIGMPPPRSKETDKIKKAIREEHFNYMHKTPMPKTTLIDQLGQSEDDEHSCYFMSCDYECIVCKKEYIPIVCSKTDWSRYRRADGTQYLICNECKGKTAKEV